MTTMQAFEDDTDNWDPQPHERQCYMHILSGDYGWLVRREGKDVIKLDRPGLDEIRPFDVQDWRSREEVRPMSPGQLAKVMFDADKALCLALGLRDTAKIEWLSLKPEKRRAWIEVGPSEPPIRAQLYAAIKNTLRHLTGT